MKTQLAIFLAFLCTEIGFAEITLELKSDDVVVVKIDGELFTEYRTNFQGTPILWPIIGPSGKEMTRRFPMDKDGSPAEAKDHPHHRSLWMTHGNVNGVDFWATGKDKGIIRHNKFLKKLSDGNVATLVTQNDWLSPKDESVVCTDVRTLRFGQIGDVRFIDFDITITASEKDVLFGDTKEGSFGIRVPGSMDVDAKKRNSNWGGQIVNAEGLKNDNAWAKRSAWVDYSGPVDGETLGITVMNHPASFRFPTHWHVRTYGLFAANPFGINDFENLKEKDESKKAGIHLLKQGDSITLRYRVLLHKGNIDNKKHFVDYVKTQQ